MTVMLIADFTSTVITQIFPDDYHLHTLDLFLSAMSRLNPHVNVKNIVIGLMDRLSSYAARESETVPEEERKKSELEAAAEMMNKLKIADANGSTKPTTWQRGDDESEAIAKPQVDEEGSQSAISSASAAAVSEIPENQSKDLETTETNGEAKKVSAIPNDIKLFETFYDQVMNLTRTQRLPLADTMALLVSLSNLAL